MRIKGWLIRICTKALLGLLNSRFLNHSPCRYGYIGNIDAFEYQHLRSSEAQQQGISLKEFLDAVDRWNACPLHRKDGLTVIEADGSTHEATVWDRHELNLALTPHDKTGSRLCLNNGVCLKKQFD